MKRILATFLAALMALSALVVVPVGADYQSGDWGYTVSGSTATINRYYGSASSVTIPSTIDGYPVTALSYWRGSTDLCGVFYGRSTMSVTIPDSVTTIGNYAFYGCSSLTSVTVPESVTSIGNSVFRNCTSLSSITLPGSVRSIGDQSFDNTAFYNNAANWENGALYLGRYLLKVEKSLSGKCRIKQGTVLIASRAIRACDLLESVSLPDSLTSVDAGLFYDCSSLSGVYIPPTVTSIGNGAFCNCLSLASVTIPDSVKSIGDSAFINCGNLTEIRYGGTKEKWDAVTIGANNEQLEEVTFVFNCAVHKHEFVAVITAPTCTEAGFTTYTCACGESYTDDEVPPFGTEHTPAPAVDENRLDPTCCAAGSVERAVYCAVCGAEISRESVVIPPLGHSFSEWVAFVAPHCTDPGYEFRYCRNDASHIEIRSTSPSGHALVHKEASAPGCERDGNIEYWKCEKCGKFFADASAQTELTEEQTTLAATGHVWSDWSVLIAPTYTESGVEFRFCLNDGTHSEFSSLNTKEDVLSGLNGDVHTEFRAIPKLSLLPGDTDGNGRLNAEDVMNLMRYMVGYTDENFVFEAADFNGDGKINNRDVLMLMQEIVNG